MLWLVALSWSLPRVVAAQDVLAGYETHDAPTGPIRARGWGEREVRWARDVLPGMTREIEARVRAEKPTRFVTILARSGAELRRIVREVGGRDPGAMVRGVAFPSRRWIVLRGDLFPGELPEDPTTVTLRHEVAHLVLHARAPSGLPRWFDEGAAEWLSNGALHPRIETHLSVLARTGSLYRLETLQSSFPGGHVSTSLAYGQSLLMVRWIVAHRGSDAIARILDGLSEGESFAAAFEGGAGLTIEAFAERFPDWIAQQRSLGEIALALVANTWTIIGVLALAAALRGIVKRRRGMRELERAEAEEEDDDERGEEREPAAEGEADDDDGASEVGVR